MSVWKRYCQCDHPNHHDGTGHPASVEVSGQHIVQAGWKRGAPFEVCRDCKGAGHVAVSA